MSPQPMGHDELIAMVFQDQARRMKELGAVLVNEAALDALIDALGPSDDEIVRLIEEEHGPLVFSPPRSL